MSRDLPAQLRPDSADCPAARQAPSRRLVIRTPGGKLTWLRALGSRRAEAITAVLEFFTGFLITDGYTAYQQMLPKLTGIQQCAQHVIRRCRAVTKLGAGSLQCWAADVIEILREAHRLTEEARARAEPADAELLRIPSSFRLTLAAGIALTCKQAAARPGRGRGWEIRSAGSRSKGERWYAWAWLGTASARHHLLIHRHLAAGELAFHYCYLPDGQSASPSRLVRAPPAPARQHRALAGLAPMPPGPVTLVPPASTARPRYRNCPGQLVNGCCRTSRPAAVRDTSVTFRAFNTKRAYAGCHQRGSRFV